MCEDLEEIAGEKHREFAMGFVYRRKWSEVLKIMRRKRGREKGRLK